MFGSVGAVADLFRPFNDGEALTKSAISQWVVDVPPLREFQIRALVPDIDERIAALKPKRERRNGHRRAA